MQKYLLPLILLLAVFFRFFWLTYSPPALNWDEVSIGYNAYSILKTGKDEWGELLPLSFKAFGEHKLPGMIYASIPGIAIFGLTDFGLRVTPALLGVIAVYLIYLLSRRLLGATQPALFAAGLMAVSPWAVHFSRASFEAGLALVFILASIYYLLPAMTRPKYLWLSLLFAILASYTYNSIRILLPLLLVSYLLNQVIPWHKLKKTTLIPLLLVGLFAFAPIILSLSTSEGRVRWGTLSITNQKSFVDDIASSRGYTTLPGPLPRLIHNKATHYTYSLFHNYLGIFSTDFLFFSGGDNTQRSVQGMGLLYLFELPLIVLGLTALINQSAKYKTARRVLLPWLLLAPIPSILTIDSPSTVRALNLLPVLVILSGLGASVLFKYLHHKPWLKIIFLMFVVWNIAYFMYQLFMVYPVKYSDEWQYGYKQAVEYAVSHQSDANLIYLPAQYGEPYIFTLFYTAFDPSTYHSLPKSQETDPTGWIHNKGFGQFRFSDYSGLETPEEIVARNQGKLVLITGFAQLPASFERTLEVKAPNWKVMFEATVQQGKQ